MRVALCAFACSLLMLNSCGTSSEQPVAPPKNGGAQKSEPPPVTREAGNLGGHSSIVGDDLFGCTMPYLRVGPRQIVFGLRTDPATPWRPSFALLMKLPSAFEIDTTFSSETQDEQNVQQQVLRCGFGTSTDKRFPVAFRYTKATLPVTESLSLQGQDCPLEAGRVFLVDLSVDPVTVTQLDVEIPLSIPDGTDMNSVKEHTSSERLLQAAFAMQAASDEIRQFADLQ